MRTWLSWIAFALAMAVPSAIFLVIAWRSAEAERVEARTLALERRVRAATDLRRGIELSLLHARERLLLLPGDASPREIADLMAEGDDPFARPFIRTGGWVRQSLIRGALVSPGDYPMELVVPRRPGVTDEAADRDVKNTVRAIEVEPLAAFVVSGYPDAEDEHKRGATKFLRTKHGLLGIRHLGPTLSAGWLVSVDSVLRGAQLPPDLVLETRDERDPHPSIDLQGVLKYVDATVVEDDETPTLSAPTTAENTADVRLGPHLLFRVVPRNPALAEMLVAERGRTTQRAALFGVLLLVAAATTIFVRGRRAQKLAELRTDFVAAVSHELRTPLASVRMFAELLESNAVPLDERAEVERTLAGETRRLHATLDRMLRFGALARGKLAVEKAESNLAVLAKDAVARLHRQHRDAQVHVEIEPSLVADVDVGLVGVALDNLLGNAAKYAHTGGPYIVRAYVDGKSVALAVVDHGPGLDRAARARVFRPFDRADARLSKATQGTGVGLALVRGIARAHGGDATVESAPGQGATFILRFPRG